MTVLIQTPSEQPPGQNPMPEHEIDPVDQPPLQNPEAPQPDPNTTPSSFPLPEELDPVNSP